MNKTFTCSMQKKKESLAKKSESGDALKKVVDAASAALNKYDSDNVDVILDEETGELVVMFHSSKTSHPITNTGVYADDVDLRQLEKELDKLTVGYVFESKKSEDYKNFTLKQLRFQLKNGWAKDLTNASDEEIQAIIDSGHSIGGVSNGTYGMNGLLVNYTNPDGSIGSGVVIGRTPNLFALLSPQKPKKTGDAPKPSESKKSEGVGGKIKMGIDYNMFMRMCASAAYLDDNEDYWDALWEYYSEMGEIEDACEFFDNLFQYTSWCDEDEVYDEYLDDSYKDGTKSKAECIEAAVDAGDLDVFKTDKGYLVIQ